jgi:hypothetical protein
MMEVAVTTLILPGCLLIGIKDLWFKALTYILLFFSGLFLVVQL